MRISLALIIDTIFSLFLSFILSFVLLNYFMPRPYSIITASCFSGIFCLFAFKILLKKRNERLSSSKEKKQYENAITQLHFMSHANLCEFMQSALIKKGYSVEKKRNGLRLTDKNAFLVFKFGFESATKSDVVKAFNLKNNGQTVYLLSETFSADVISFASRFTGLTLVDGKKLFEFLKENDSLPETKFVLERPKLKFFNAIKSLLSRKKAKTFAVFGIIFLLSSPFVPIKLYYVIVGALFLIFSIICLLFGNQQTKSNK